MAAQSDRPPVLRDISVVIPTLGRPILEQCLRSIVAGSAWPAGIIVVDQSSSRTVQRWLAEITAEGVQTDYLASNERGRARGVNRGIERVATRFLAITDDDCAVHPEWLVKMWERLVENPEAIVTGRVETAGEGAVAMGSTSRKATTYRRPRLSFDPMSGGNMGTSVDVFRRVGLLDEDPRVRFAEDGEWVYRALRAGVPLVYAPETVVTHCFWRDPGERAAQLRLYARSQGGFYGKYIRKGDWFIALRAALHHVRALRRWLRGIRTGDRELALIGRAYFTGLLPGILSGFRKAAPASEPPIR